MLAMINNQCFLPSLLAQLNRSLKRDLLLAFHSDHNTTYCCLCGDFKVNGNKKMNTITGSMTIIAGNITG